VNIYII